MNEKTKTDRKSLRRKIHQKIETIVKKVVELENYGYEVLLIARFKESNNWTNYSSNAAEEIFFSFQNAKNHLNAVEIGIKKNALAAVENSCKEKGFFYPEPVKVFKSEDSFENFQTIFSAENLKLECKVQKSILSTDFNSIDNQSLFSPTCKEKHTDNFKPHFSFEANLVQVEDKSSPDFDFETYFNS